VTLLLSLSLETGGSEQPLKHTDLRLNPQERKSHLLCASQPVPSSSAALVPPSGRTREPSQTCTCVYVIGIDIRVRPGVVRQDHVITCGIYCQCTCYTNIFTDTHTHTCITHQQVRTCMNMYTPIHGIVSFNLKLPDFKVDAIMHNLFPPL